MAGSRWRRIWAVVAGLVLATMVSTVGGVASVDAAPASYQGRWTGSAAVETCTAVPGVGESCSTGDTVTRAFTLIGDCDGVGPCELVTQPEYEGGSWGWGTGAQGDCLSLGAEVDYTIGYSPLPMSMEATLGGTTESPSIAVFAIWPHPVQPPGGVSVLRVSYTAVRWSTDVPAPTGGCGGPPPCTPMLPGPFSDVPSESPFCADIAWMATSGVSEGYEDGTFRPAKTVSRQAMASFLHRFAGSPEPTLTEPFFADVGPSHPFYDAIQWMAQSGLSTGSPQGSGKPLYKPSDVVSRQAMAAFLYRFAGSPPVTLPLAYFADVTGGPFFQPVQWMAQSGLSTGTPQTSGAPLYKPAASVTRQAMAAFLHRFDESSG